MVNQRGFNLIELMIVVAIIAILAAIAYPSYQDSVRRTKRADMQTTMLQLAAQIQRYKVANFRVTGATAADLGIATSYPLQGDELYHVKISWLDAQGAQKDTAALGSEKWLLTATPVAATSQAGDGHLVLNHRGERCWQKGTDKPSGSACVPSSETDWNNR